MRDHRGVAALLVWLLGGLGCEPADAPRVPVVHAASVPEAATSDPPPPAAPQRLFRERLRLEDAGLCHLMGMAPVAGGAAWVVGDCNLRLLLRADGFEDHAGKWVETVFPFGSQSVRCTARWIYPAVVAASATEAHVLAERRCGLDPSTLAPAPLEGLTKGAFQPRPSPVEPWLWELARTPDGTLYGMVTEETGGATPDGAIYRRGQGGWEKVSLAPPADLGETGGPTGQFAVSPKGVIWIAGSGGGGVWRGDAAGGWSWHAFEGCDFVADIDVAPDETVWLACSAGVLHMTPAGAVTRVGPGAQSVWARSATEVWMAGSDVRRWDGAKLHEVNVEGRDPETAFDEIVGHGETVWLRDRTRAWALASKDAPAPSLVRMQPSMTPPAGP